MIKLLTTPESLLIHTHLNKASARNIYYLTQSWNKQITACLTVITRRDNAVRMRSHIKECSGQPSPMTLLTDSLPGSPIDLRLKLI